jgi:hypothetical protein
MDDFEWAIDTPIPSLYVGVKVVINHKSSNNTHFNQFEVGEYIVLEITEITDIHVNYVTTETTRGVHLVGAEGRTSLSNANELISSNWWRPYED